MLEVQFLFDHGTVSLHFIIPFRQRLWSLVTTSLHSDDPIEGADGTTESEPEQALPILPRNNKGFTEGHRHLDEFTLV